MKKLLLIAFFFSSCSLLFCQGICNPAGNIIIYSNYDGGELNIEIDEDIPNIKIGICSYESIDVNITGVYSDNITKVLYAGYDNDGTTSISGVDIGIVEILLYPPVTLSDEDGYPYMICAYDCDTDYVPGGCNTVDQLSDYFLIELDGALRFTELQYPDFGSSIFQISDGGNCCVGEIECEVTLFETSDQSICIGETIELNVSGADNYSWFPEIPCVSPCNSVEVSPTTSTEYVITGSNADGCFGTDTIIVNVYPEVLADIELIDGILYGSGGDLFQWLIDGEIISGANDSSYEPIVSGNYSVEITSADGCKDTSNTIILILQSIQQHSSELEFYVYPNPTPQYMQFTLHDFAMGNYSITIFNSSGDKIYASEYIKSNPIETKEIDCSNFQSGYYFVEIIFSEKCAKKSFVIIK